MTKVSAGGAEAVYNEEEDCWESPNQAFEDDLNAYHDENKPPVGANPFPAGVAVELAKKAIEGLKVVSIDTPPKYDEEAVY
jgi:hypothetical protein